jgi:hypothetical protein
MSHSHSYPPWRQNHVARQSPKQESDYTYQAANVEGAVGVGEDEDIGGENCKKVAYSRFEKLIFLFPKIIVPLRCC